MAPDLFLWPIDKILEETVSQGHLCVNIVAECLTDLDYAFLVLIVNTNPA